MTAAHNILETIPVDPEAGLEHRRCYVDGRRVSIAALLELERRATRWDTFSTSRKGDRWHHRKVIRL